MSMNLHCRAPFLLMSEICAHVRNLRTQKVELFFLHFAAQHKKEQILCAAQEKIRFRVCGARTAN